MTTRECVQLVTGSYFRSRKKDGGHAIRSVVGSYAALTLHRSVCYRRRVISDGNSMHLLRDHPLWTFRSCDLDLDPMTFIYELDPYCLDIHRSVQI